MTKTGNLRVRDIGSDRVSMLKALDEAAKGQDRNLGSGDDETGKGETVSMEKHVFFL